MPNIAQVLKEEIARLARKEVRAETDSLKKTVSNQRSDIARLKREIATLQRQVKRSTKNVPAAPQAASQEDTGFRFSAKGLASNRERLGLSAEQYGALVGVTGQSIYKWEAGKARPRASQIPAIAQLRGIGKREAAKRLESLSA